MSVCTATNHLPEVPNKEFRCPKCKAKCGDFCVDEGHADNECEQLLGDDNLICYKCGHGESAATFVRRWLGAKKLIVCPSCKGTGHVKA
jgi:hypothetical protein